MASREHEDLADALDRIAVLLEVQGASSFRVRAYRRAAATVREQECPLRERLADSGRAGLEQLPGVGRSIGAVIAEFLRSGRIVLLERLEGQVSPEDLLCTVPGIGEELAARIHRELEVDTLEELELAAHDGRLAALAGFGERRVLGVRDSLAGILGRSARRRAHSRRASLHAAPGLKTLLGVDEEYRRRAEGGELQKIAPRRFNPEARAWLPILHCECDGFAFTALYSNTARAHQLGKTRDWVVLYWERDGEEGQCTVVTEPRGRLAGQRVVRGREREVLEGAGPGPRTRRRSAAQTLLALVALLLLGTCGAQGCRDAEPPSAIPREPAARAALGHEWFDAYCASCHGTEVRGDGPAAAGLSAPPPDLTGIATRRGGLFDLDEIAAYIDGRTRVTAHGSSEMPVWGRGVPDRFDRPGVEEPILSPGAISLILEYLRSIQSEKRAQASPGCARPARTTPCRAA